jgi:predicted phosphodiesterase
MLQERWLVFSDVHGPWNDPRLSDLVLDIGEDINCTHVFLNGDILDFFELNQHSPKDPDIITNLEDEMHWGIEFIKKLRRKFPTQKIIFNAGNHEFRLDRFIIKNCKPFWGFLSVDKQLQLEHYNIEYYPYNHAYQIPGTDIYLQHSPPSYSQNAARTSLLKKMAGSFIWGCSHRPDSAYLSSYDGRRHEAHLLGWLGSTTLTDQHKLIFRYTKGHESWGNSFATIDIVGNDHFIQHHIIKNYKTVVNGVLYEG